MQFLRFMSTPVGRAIRAVMGIVLIGAGLVVGGGLGIALAVFGVLPLFTGIANVCPISPFVGEPMRGGPGCGLPADDRHGRKVA